jgi:hypothetical protein
LLINHTFNNLKSSSVRGRLHFSWLKCKNWERSNQSLLIYSTFNNLNSSSNRCCLHFTQFWLSVWSPKLKFKFWELSVVSQLRNNPHCNQPLSLSTFTVFLCSLLCAKLYSIVQYIFPVHVICTYICFKVVLLSQFLLEKKINSCISKNSKLHL